MLIVNASNTDKDLAHFAKYLPDYDCTVEYQIFWYNEDEIYFDHTDVMTEKFVSDVPECARYCRIMVIPSNLDENGKPIKDFEVKFWETYKYVNTLTVKVNKDQTWQPIDYYEIAQTRTAPEGHEYTPTLTDGYMFYNAWYYMGNSTFELGMSPFDANHVVVKLDCTDVSEYSFTFSEKDFEQEIFVGFFKSDGVPITIYRYAGLSGDTVICTIPDDAAYVVVNVVEEFKPIIINKYLPRTGE